MKLGDDKFKGKRKFYAQKSVSLYPLKFDEAVAGMLKVKTEPKEGKPTKRTNKSKKAS